MNIRYAKLDDIKDFLANIGNSSQHFRYFSKRPPEVINHHLVTLIGTLDNGETIAYAHLDPDDGKIWLGVCIVETHCGKGFGKVMTAALLKEADKLGIKDITLSVDEDNLAAIKLYKKSGFIQINAKDGILYLIRSSSYPLE